MFFGVFGPFVDGHEQIFYYSFALAPSYSQVGSNGAGPKHIFAHKNKTCFEVFLYEDFVTTARGWPRRFGAHRELHRGYRMHFVPSVNDASSLRNTWPKIHCWTC